MSKKLHILLLLLFINQLGYSQVEECGTDFFNNGLVEDVSSVILNQELKSGRIGKALALQNSEATFKIPVVIHVFKDDGRKELMASLTEAKIKEWLDYTNKVFKGEYNPKSIPMNIEFVLATMDENCNPSSGIVWVDAHSKLPNYSQYGISNSNKKDYPNAYLADDLRAISYWNPKKYLNIFVVNDANGPLGFASYPGADNPINVIVVNFVRIGASTGPHELGHSLGLIHTFEGDEKGTVCPPNTNCLTQGDKVCDTNPHISFGNCPLATTLNCDNVAFGAMEFDLRNNVMSYSNCSQDLFTLGQKQRAREQYSLNKLTVINSLPTKSYNPSNIPNQSSMQACITSSSSLSSAFGAGLIYFKLGTIDNSSKGIGDIPSDFTRAALVDYTGDNTKCIEKNDYITYLNKNESQEISLGVSTNAQSVKVYIDYNNDGVFDENTERVVSAVQSPGQSTYKFTPSSTTLLNTPLRLRAVADRNSGLNATNPCTLSNGQAEDYTVIFVEGTSVPVEVTVEIIKQEKQ